MKKIAIIHFQPLELYPPVTNLINYVSEQDFTGSVKVFTTKSDRISFTVNKDFISIFRYGKPDSSRSLLYRIFEYVLFYLRVVFSLVKYKPSSILYFESLSFLPVYFYCKLAGIFIKKSPQILCHYHEYTTNAQYKSGMFLDRFNHTLEKKVYNKMDWISHTNQDRADMFLKNNPDVVFRNIRILPNYPPAQWTNFNSGKRQGIPFKVVYVGALGMDTMYIREFAEWIESFRGKVTWDIYSQQDPNSLLTFLTSISSKNINYLGNANYYDLPQILSNYDAGVILYKGHIPNYVYNAPNKLFEYAVCGLDVWFPDIMLGCLPYVTNKTYPKVIPLNFQSLGNFNLLIERAGLSYQPHNYNAGSVLKMLFEKMSNF